MNLLNNINQNIDHRLINLDNLKINHFDHNEVDISLFDKALFFDTLKFHDYHQIFSNLVTYYYVVVNNKIISYFVLGLKNRVLISNYSSPFSLIYFRPNYKIEDVINTVKAIKFLFLETKIEKVTFTLPPSIYNRELINLLISSFYSEKFKVNSIEINNYFPLLDFENIENFLKNSEHKVRKNYKRALNNNLLFKKLYNQDLNIAYNVIKENRDQLGYPLKISKQHMNDILDFSNDDIDCFIVEHENIVIAAAISFKINIDIYQIIYWGDLPSYREIRPMEFLAVNLFNYYSEKGIKYVDIGPSSENGIISSGLVYYKKSIGCLSDVKLSFYMEKYYEVN